MVPFVIRGTCLFLLNSCSFKVDDFNGRTTLINYERQSCLV
ncbi:hypothetical protein GYH30_054592 [Glycine max]|nr:hypothetical protein GYH30_054592 [Glycine max]